MDAPSPLTIGLADSAAPDQSTGQAPEKLVRGAVAVVCIALAAAIVGLATSNENDIGSLGLIEALPVVYFVAVAVVVAILVWALRWDQQPTAVMVSGVVSLVVLLYGSASILESQARFPVAWLHVGFVESITSLGHTTQTYDARFSWPGFFSGAGVLTEVSGFDSASVFLRLAPILIVLVYVPLLLVIGRNTLPGWRAPWLGVIVFLFVDWVGQDYFAPQSVAVITYLAIMAVFLTYYRKVDPGRISGWVQGLPQRFPHWLAWVGSMIHSGRRDTEPAQTPASSKRRMWILVLIAVLMLGLVSSHQLTPAILIVSILGMSVMGRLRPWPMAFFVGIAMMGWLAYAAEPFWKGHLSDIFGGLGQVGNSVDSGVGQRITGSQGHLLILKVRIYLTLLVWGLAGLGVLRLWVKDKRVSVPLLVLLAAPGTMIAAQSYGGEGLLRVFLFSLPGASMLIAGLILPLPQPPKWKTLVLLAAGFIVIFPAFLLSKWGNETFERVSTGDLQLRQEFYRVAPPGATLINFGQGGASAFQGLTIYESGANLLSQYPIKNVKQLDKAIGSNPLGTYIIVSRPAIEFGVQNSSIPPAEAAKVIKMALDSKQYEVVYKNSEGVLLKQKNPEGKTIEPEDTAPAVAQ